ncbi:LppU/SCO3897 family protein [Paractinoplanes lichenicola]|uniref:Porin n=1 Tax=Paractinoplanes lichenicola TaxID=2802976 RepID=A0ABS1VQ93_9ACTN|nr:porin [Actinoplanes lichenicola]MBL7256898.1 porin [Actinoplanes lichenicola]
MSTAPQAAPDRSRWVVVALVAGLVVAAAVYAISGLVLGGDDARDAKAGDCLASDKQVEDEGTTRTGANLVDCSAEDARFTVVARVDGESSTQSDSCNKFFQEKEEFYVYANGDDRGYLLCLRPRA